MELDIYEVAKFVNRLSLNRTTYDWLVNAGVSGLVIRQMYETEVALTQIQLNERDKQNGTNQQ